MIQIEPEAPEEAMKKRNGKKLVQVGALVLALFALAAAVNGIFIYRSNRRNYIDMLERHTGNVLQQTRTVMGRTCCWIGKSTQPAR